MNKIRSGVRAHIVNERGDRMITDIQRQLQEPFPIDDISWLPGATTKDKDKCLALAYADLRAYQNRLDDIFGMDWSVSYTPWGDRIICHVTINGITRSSTGEPDAQSNKSEIGGTASEAQAFKRACAMFGLGRYLYNLPQEWVPFDGRAITKEGKKQLDNMYSRFLKSTPLMVDTKTGEILMTAQNGPQRTQNQQPANGATVTQKTQPRPAQSATKDNELDWLGCKLYGDKWEEVLAHNIKRLTGKQQPASALTDEQVAKMVGGLKELEKRRNPVPEDVNYYDSGEEWRGMSEEADVNERKAKATGGPFVWPTDDEALEICTGLVNSPDCDSDVTKLLVEFHALAEGSTKAMSDKQYGFLVSLLDKRYNGGHNAILSALTGMIINSDFIPGWQIKVLIDWLKDADSNAGNVDRLDAMVDALKLDLQQLEAA